MAWTVRMRLVSGLVTFGLVLLSYVLVAAPVVVLLWTLGLADARALVFWGIVVGLAYGGGVVLWTHLLPPDPPADGRTAIMSTRKEPRR